MPRGREREVRVTRTPGPDGGLLRVSDTGPGIPDDVADELFTVRLPSPDGSSPAPTSAAADLATDPA